MAFNDSLSDMLARIKNAHQAYKVSTLCLKSKLNTNYIYDYLVENAIGERFDNIAGALQLMTEKLVCEWIINGIKKTSAKNIF